MKVLVEAISTPDIWKLGGSTAKLRIYANQDFQTSDGQWIPRGNINTFYMEINCTIVASVLTVPGFEIDSTVDSPDNPSATYTAELITTKNRRVMFLSSFAIDTLQDGDPSVTWGEIKLLRIGPSLQTLNTSILRQINAMIQQAVGGLNKSSENNLGVTALTEDPVDPAFPIAVGDNDTRWTQLARVGEMFINIRDHGVLPNQDNGASLQALLNRFAYNGDLKGGRLVAPAGTYDHSNQLTYEGDFGHAFVFQGANQGEAGVDDGPWFRYTGAAGGTGWLLKGANYIRFEDVNFNGNGLALKCVALHYDAARAMSSFDCEMTHVSFGGAVGVDSTLLEIGNSNFASAEHKFVDLRLIGHGVAGTTYYGIRNAGSANAKNYTIEGGGCIGLRWGVALGNSGSHKIDSMSFAGQTEGDIKPGGAIMSLISLKSEGSKRFIDGRGISSTVAGSIHIYGSYFAGVGDSDGYVVIFPGMLVISSSEFGAGPSYGDIPPKFKVGFGDVGGSIHSTGNYYNWNAVTDNDFIPFYDTSDRHIGSTSVGAAAAAHSALFSHGDKAKVVGTPTVTFPVWIPGRGLGGRNKTIAAADWAGLGGQYFPNYGDGQILAEGTAGPFGSGYNVVFVPAPAPGKGRRVSVVKTNTSAQPVAVSAGFAPNFQDGLDRILLTAQDDFVEIESDGTLYRVLSSRVGGGGSLTGAFVPPRLTTAQRDALTQSDAMLIYNTTTSKFQGRAGGAWVDLH